MIHVSFQVDLPLWPERKTTNYRPHRSRSYLIILLNKKVPHANRKAVCILVVGCVITQNEYGNPCLLHERAIALITIEWVITCLSPTKLVCLY